MQDEPATPTTPRAVETSKSDSFFPPTSWSLLARAAHPSTVTPAMSAFAELYFSAVRGFILAIVRNVPEAEELTQKFFLVVVLQGRLFDSVTPQKGRFREYLKQAIRHFLIDEHRHRTRKKRRGVGSDLRPDSAKGGWELIIRERAPAHDAAFMRGWAQSLVRVAIERVWSLCKRKGQEQHFRLFAGRYLAPALEMPSWRDIGQPFGLDEKTTRSRAETVARHFRTEMRDLIAAGRDAKDRTDDEILELDLVVLKATGE